MKRKDYEPIKFEFFQSDMERYMHFIQEGINDLPDGFTKDKLKIMKSDFQHKIDQHRKRGDWK